MYHESVVVDRIFGGTCLHRDVLHMVWCTDTVQNYRVVPTLPGNMDSTPGYLLRPSTCAVGAARIIRVFAVFSAPYLAEAAGGASAAASAQPD